MAITRPEISSEEAWLRFDALARQQADLFAADEAVLAARAPGRLDVMGGVADYSGGLVLEGTLAVSTFAAVQRRADGYIVVRSLAAGRAGWPDIVEISGNALLTGGALVSFEEARLVCGGSATNRWAAYAAGCVYVLMASGWLDPASAGGVSILIDSDVPLGAGVSSSASMEVATMEALCGLYGLQMDGLELARLCQIVENRVVGAPCGIMDQVTCALGKPGSLLRLLCRPHDLEGYSALPRGWALAGIDSGVKHSVGGGNYRRARTAAFMGLGVAERLLGRNLGGYLCALTPAEWGEIRDQVPESMTGAEYAAIYGAIPDALSTAGPAVAYRVRSSAEHPILEHARVQQFDAILRASAGADDAHSLAEAGRLMLESHRSYSEKIDLGAAETDMIVDLAMGIGASGGVYGAKITGGGSGGTVAVLGRADCIREAATSIAQIYEEATGNTATLLFGSAEGAVGTGVRHLER